MKALRWYARDDLRLEDVPDPVAADGEVIIAVHSCGICGSDIKEWREGPVVASAHKHPVTGEEPPIILGHEFIGEVVERGRGVDSLAVGQRVAVEGEMRCGRCWFCLRGDYQLCQDAAYIGFNRDGGLAEYVAVPTVQAIPVPDDVPDDIAALVEPMAVAVHALSKSGLQLGQSLVVVGAGTVGLGVVAAARAVGAGDIFVIEPSASRRQRALEFGATEAVSPLEDSPTDLLRALTEGGRGADFAFECSGHPSSVQAAIDVTRKGGTVVTVGLHGRPVTVDVNTITMADKRIVGSLGYVNDFPRTFTLLADKRIDAASLVTSRIPLTQAIPDGFEALADVHQDHLKILISPRGAGA